jgi:DNA-directed RNA polymerase subunit omega
MARITVEDCLMHVPNRFSLVLLAAERTKQLLKGEWLLIENDKENKDVVNSLREIAAGKVLPDLADFDENAGLYTAAGPMHAQLRPVADDDLPPEPEAATKILGSPLADLDGDLASSIADAAIDAIADAL